MHYEPMKIKVLPRLVPPAPLPPSSIREHAALPVEAIILGTVDTLCFLRSVLCACLRSAIYALFSRAGWQILDLPRDRF